MPCHYSYREGGFVSMSSVIGTQIPQATGAAMAAKIRKDPVVVMGYLGDGATSATDFHTALNFAAVFAAPVVFFCQNNQWAISVPFSKQTASEGVAVKAEAYCMPGISVDGNDVLAVYQATKEAVDRARAGGGPSLIEAITFRMGGHSSSDDPARYRDEGQVKMWRERDPLERTRKLLEERGLWDDAKEQAQLDEHMVQISSAVTQAERIAPPSPETLVNDVFASLTPHLAAQRAELLRFAQGRKPSR
jgi:TPP-dependent pyruvate/acetoin dehydrogenase alpha subunit